MKTARVVYLFYSNCIYPNLHLNWGETLLKDEHNESESRQGRARNPRGDGAEKSLSVKKHQEVRLGNDDNLKDLLQTALDSDKNLRGYGLRADVVEGEAQLHGIVDTLSEKHHAERVARSIEGIRKVDSAISISTDGKISDSDVEFEVSEELEADPDIDTRNIGARSSKGVVALVGHTDGPQEVEKARQAAAKARGVTRVVSHVKIGEEEFSPEEIFHSQVRTDDPWEKGDEKRRRRQKDSGRERRG